MREPRAVLIKAFLLFISIVLLDNNSAAQSPVDFFPHGVGNLHIYDDIVDVSHIYTFVSRDVVDSVDAFGTNYIVQRQNTVGFSDTSDHYYVIDSLGNVNEYFWDRWKGYNGIILKAQVAQGDRWWVHDTPVGQVVAVVETTYAGSYLGVSTIFKQIAYFNLIDTNNLDSEGFELYDRAFARGLGVIFYGGGELFERYYLRAACVDGNLYGDTTVVSANDPPARGLPQEISLRQNYPNPFNPSTQIRYTLPKAADVTLKIFNVLGEEVATLVADRQQPGEHTVTWDASNMPSGVYFCRLTAGGFLKTKKMVLVK